MAEYNLKTTTNQQPITSVPPRLSEAEAQALQVRICAEEFNRMTNGRDYNRNQKKMEKELRGCGDGQLEVIEEKVIDPRVNRLLHFRVSCATVPPLFNSIAFALPKGMEVCDFSPKSNRPSHIDRGTYEIFIEPNERAGFADYTVVLKPHFVGALKISHPGPDGKIHSKFIFTHNVEAARPTPAPRIDGPILMPVPETLPVPPNPSFPSTPTPIPETGLKSNETSKPSNKSNSTPGELRSILRPKTLVS